MFVHYHLRNFVPMLCRFAICVFLFIASDLFAVSEDSTTYSKDFIFREGIYLSYDQFKHNSPIEIKRIVSDYDKTRLDFLKSITGKKEITFLNDSNRKVTLRVDSIWGYCQNQALYIKYGDDFFRVPIIGNLSHFLGYQYVTTAYPNAGMYGSQQVYQGAVKEQTQFVFDHLTRQVVIFNVGSMEVFLQRDEALYKEFMALSNKKKRQSTFLYLRKYNEKHPLYILNR